ncbi:hypothetical protein PQX77_003513 [Marasmius sp. AFHP31]|nr:hypothetical protein PQX77_003513 [Marasmius sp. AFHP31]
MVTQRETGLFYQLLYYSHLMENVTELDMEDMAKLQELMQMLWDQSICGKFEAIGFPLPFHRIDMLLKDPKTSELGWSLGVLMEDMGRSSSTTDPFWVTSMRDLAQYTISASPNYMLHNTTVTTSSLLVKSDPGSEFISRMHRIILDRNINYYTSWEDDDRWTEAVDIVCRIHQLPQDHFEPMPGYFPLSLLKLEKDLKSLSLPTDHMNLNFKYLGSFRKHWDKADFFQKERLIHILSHHINTYVQLDVKSPTRL